MTKHVAVLVPGAMGSVLKLGEETIWPNLFSKDLAHPEKEVEKLLDPGLEATDVIRSYLFFSTQYKALIDDLENWNFHEEEKEKPPTLRLVPYDWRKTYANAAERLSQVLD